MKSETAQISYTTINHLARKQLGLSWLEYGLADLIFNLQSNPNSDYPGWCYASKETLALNLDTTKQTVHSLLNKLLKKKLVEKHPITKHLKITIDWYNTVIIKDSKETLPTVKQFDSSSKETLLTPSKETLHNKDINNKDRDNEYTKDKSLETQSPVKIDKRDPKIQKCIDALSELMGNKVPKESLNRFALKRMIGAYGEDKIIRGIKFAYRIRAEDRYAPKIYNYLDLEEKWLALIDYGRANNMPATSFKAVEYTDEDLAMQKMFGKGGLSGS